MTPQAWLPASSDVQAVTQALQVLKVAAPALEPRLLLQALQLLPAVAGCCCHEAAVVRQAGARCAAALALALPEQVLPPLLKLLLPLLEGGCPASWRRGAVEAVEQLVSTLQVCRCRAHMTSWAAIRCRQPGLQRSRGRGGVAACLDQHPPVWGAGSRLARELGAQPLPGGAWFRTACRRTDARRPPCATVQARLVPVVALLLTPVMARMSDPLSGVRRQATLCFGMLVALLPLAQGTPLMEVGGSRLLPSLPPV